jgi:hypothetical protein
MTDNGSWLSCIGGVDFRPAWQPQGVGMHRTDLPDIKIKHYRGFNCILSFRYYNWLVGDGREQCFSVLG